MGLMDFFKRGGDDPQRKLMRMPLRELRERRIEVDMTLKSAFRQIEKLRAEYDETIEKGRASSSENEMKLLASEAKKIRQRIELHQRDFDGLKDALENLDALITIREGVGDNTQRVEKELQSLIGLSQHEFSKALQAKSAEYERSRIRMKERDGTLTDYASTRGSAEEESPELAMMRQGREPSLAKPVEPPVPEKQTETKAEKKQTVTEEQE